MTGVDTIARIRREHFVRGKTIKEIVRELHVSRNTVRKALRSGATAFEYEREVQPLPKLGPWRDDLDRLLTENEGRSARERLTLIRIFEALRALGYEGGYDAVRRYARGRQRERSSPSAAFVPLSFDPGEAYQFDWSHEIVLINGVTTTVKVAHVRLCHSRMLFVRAYPRESQEMVFDAHDRAFAFFKGTCTRGIYDNMKTAVETILVGLERAYNRRFLQMCSHYMIDPVACTPASGWEKGQVEIQVGLALPRHDVPRRHASEPGQVEVVHTITSSATTMPAATTLSSSAPARACLASGGRAQTCRQGSAKLFSEIRRRALPHGAPACGRGALGFSLGSPAPIDGSSRRRRQM